MTDLPPIPPRTFSDSLKQYWPFIVPIVAGGWIAVTWLQDQRELEVKRQTEASNQTLVRRFEAQKPFRDKQFELYVETAKVVGKLVTSSDLTAAEWNENFQRYEQLYWTELSMVEDEGVKKAMQSFASKLLSIKEHGARDEDSKDLKDLAYQLALALRTSIENNWKIELSTSKPIKLLNLQAQIIAA